MHMRKLRPHNLTVENRLALGLHILVAVSPLEISMLMSIRGGLGVNCAVGEVDGGGRDAHAPVMAGLVEQMQEVWVRAVLILHPACVCVCVCV